MTHPLKVGETCLQRTVHPLSVFWRIIRCSKWLLKLFFSCSYNLTVQKNFKVNMAANAITKLKFVMIKLQSWWHSKAINERPSTVVSRQHSSCMIVQIVQKINSNGKILWIIASIANYEGWILLLESPTPAILKAFPVVFLLWSGLLKPKPVSLSRTWFLQSGRPPPLWSKACGWLLQPSVV